MTPTEALAAALHRIHSGPRPWPGGLTDDEMADHILAALDGWTLVPTAAPAEGLRFHHPDDDFVAITQRYRNEHEATHGEAEQCGGPCIALGLCDPPAEGLDVDRLRDALKDMVDQFAYWGGDGITTGGLSALEEAFEVLGYSDPQPAPWRGCDEPDCKQEGTSGWPSPSGYRRTCHEHSDFHLSRRCNWHADSSHWAGDAQPEDDR